MDISSAILTKKQIAYGFSLQETEDFVFLIRGGEKLATYNSKTVTINKIREDADQFLNEQESGISYEGVI